MIRNIESPRVLIDKIFEYNFHSHPTGLEKKLERFA
jgi:hypothetical protein